MKSHYARSRHGLFFAAHHHLMLELFLAIFALQVDFALALLDAKARGHRLRAADAVAVRAVQHAVDTVRQAWSQLLHHLVIVDAIHRGFRRVDRQLVDLLLGQEGVFDFNNVFAAQLVRRQIQADGDALVGFSQLKQRQQLEAYLSRKAAA